MGKVKIILGAVLFLILGVKSNSYAQEKTLSLDEVLDVALQNNGNLKAKYLEIKSAQKLQRTAFELPNTEIEMQLGNNNGVENDKYFQVLQIIPFPSVFVMKHKLAKAQIKAKKLEYEVTGLDLKKQLRVLFYKIQHLQHNKKHLTLLDSLYNDCLKIAKKHYRTGDAKKLEINMAENQKAKIDLLLSQNEVYLKNAYQNLQVLMNTKENFKVFTPEKFEPIKLSILLDKDSISRHPILKLSQQRIEIAERNKKLQRAQLLPSFSIGYITQSMKGIQTVSGKDRYFGANDSFNSVIAGISIPLTFMTSNARIQSFKIQKEIAQLTADQQQLALEQELENATNQYKHDLQQLAYYQEKALPNATKIATEAKQAYRKGEINYIEYLHALQSATDTQLAYLESIQQVNISVIKIYSLTNQ